MMLSVMKDTLVTLRYTLGCNNIAMKIMIGQFTQIPNRLFV